MAEAGAVVAMEAMEAGAGVADAGAARGDTGRASFYHIFYDAAFWICSDGARAAWADAVAWAGAAGHMR
ncbi:hypothetical protein [Niabella aurantiaca]|uniref:hypothetical protein n=1 Tax=Niabella aurantiaca TaxID=379900 RepID=UPI00039E96F0|nr:hypothetical protein [Niabella aurantiaca]